MNRRENNAGTKPNLTLRVVKNACLSKVRSRKQDAKMIYKGLVELKLRSFKPYLPEDLDLCRGLLILVEIMISFRFVSNRLISLLIRH